MSVLYLKSVDKGTANCLSALSRLPARLRKKYAYLLTDARTQAAKGNAMNSIVKKAHRKRGLK